MSNVTIAGINVRQDSEGRFSLNDLHKAAVNAGANARTKETQKFLDREEAADLITELKTQNLGVSPVDSKRGRYGGTYVVKELVYAYAMWISPAFHLKVIRAYDALVNDQLRVAEGKASRESARLEAPAMTNAVTHQRGAQGKATRHYHYTNKFDMINRIALGKTAKQYKKDQGLSSNDALRDDLTPCEIKCIEHLQRVNSGLIDIGMEYQQRKEKLSQVYFQQHAAALLQEIEQEY